MKFDIKSYGELSSLPYLLQWIMAYVYGFLADWVITKKVTSITSTRKIMNAIAFLGPALALILIGNSDSNLKIYVLVILMVGVSCISAGKSGHLINYVDLSPNHAGTIMGIANGSSIGFASLGNVMVHFIVTNDQNSNQWRIIFYCAAVIYVFATIVYCVFGSGEVQPWNEKKAKNRAVI
ncbi:unnamed protein product [Psylliodes chrysocephalus]|nr:unnamed protein product [Psylliodes chrysocephala]